MHEKHADSTYYHTEVESCSETTESTKDSVIVREIWADGELKQTEREHFKEKNTNKEVVRFKDSIVYIARIDSIPYPVEIEVPVEVERKIGLKDYLALAGVAAIAFFIGKIKS